MIFLYQNTREFRESPGISNEFFCICPFSMYLEQISSGKWVYKMKNSLYAQPGNIEDGKRVFAA